VPAAWERSSDRPSTSSAGSCTASCAAGLRFVCQVEKELEGRHDRTRRRDLGIVQVEVVPIGTRLSLAVLARSGPVRMLPSSGGSSNR
jgi:hypothetical protein